LARSAGIAHVLVLGLTASAGAQPATSAATTLVVGTKEAPPFAMKAADGTWSGLSIELWRDIAREEGYDFELRETDVPGLITGVSSGQMDLAVAALTITPEREAALDFTHPFHVSGLGIAVPAGGAARVLPILSQFLSVRFLRVVIGLAILLFAVAILVWLFERRRNPEQFGGGAVHGIGAGFWWSAVTMTTVGYGDKSPVTVGGRLVALVWMFTALIVISSFTAAITAALTVGSLTGRVRGPDDLADVRVGTVPETTSASYLDWRQLPYASYDSIDDALAALTREEIDAVVYDAPILRYEVRRGFNDQLSVLASTFERQYYGIALPSGSPLREPLNRAVLAHIATPEWQSTLQRYLGQGR
jgi:polar amino acid transport system substrate-binding protein